MAHRTLFQLEWAEPCKRPAHIPKGRPRGAKAAGLRYEKALAEALPKAVRGQWFRFADANGPGHCQMDLLVPHERKIFVIECKLTNVEEGRLQLMQLYLPIARLVWPKRTVCGIVAARHLSQRPALVTNTLDEAYAVATEGRIPVLHWIEKTPL